MGKRANREGTITPRPNGTWMGQITVGYDWVTGKATRKTVYAPTQRECREKLDRLKEEEPTQGHSMKIRDVIDQWIADARRRVDVATVHGYTNTLNIVKEALGKVPLCDLSAMKVTDMTRFWDRDGVAMWKQRAALARLRAVLKYAHRMGLVTTNVAMIVDLPRYTGKEVNPLSMEAAGSLLREAETAGYLPFFCLALDSGGRMGELLALLWEDLDLLTPEVYFKRTVQIGRGKEAGTFRVKVPKTPKSRRRVNLTERTGGALREWQEGAVTPAPMMARRTRRRSSIEVPGLVFPDPLTGGYWNLGTFRSSVWDPLKKKAGLPSKTRLHDLRHTMATLLLLANVNPKIVSERLGHASITITLDTYSHLLPTMQQSAVTALEAGLFRLQ